jgi:hypothetical protein
MPRDAHRRDENRDSSIDKHARQLPPGVNWPGIMLLIQYQQ